MKRWKQLSPIWQPFWNRRISLYASSACFYMIVSLLPSAVLVLSILSRFPPAEDSLTSFLQTILPSRFLPLVEYAKTIVPKHSTAAVSLFTLLWSASKGTLSIAEGLQTTNVYENRPGFLRRRFWGIVYFLLLWAAITVMLLAYVFGQSILNDILVQATAVSQLWELLLQLRFLYTIGLLSLFFGLIYRIIPHEKAEKRYCLLSGLIVASVWSVFSWLFSLYVNYIASYQRLYGGIGLLLLMAIWLHICIIILLQGGVLCQLISSENYHPIRLVKKVFTKKHD